VDRNLEEERQQAVTRYFAGEGVGSIAAALGRSAKWVRKWVERSVTGELDWFREDSRKPKRVAGRSSPLLEDLIVALRLELEAEGLFCGAEALLWELENRGVENLPTARTVARILSRRGANRRRTGGYERKGKRYPAPDSKSLSRVHQSDFVGPRYGSRPLRFYSLNTVELFTGRCAVQPMLQRDAQSTVDAVWATWHRLGVPRIQQLDNESVFYGSVRHPRGMGAVIRLCLLHDVEPWFIPLAEPWRNGVVEKFNDFFQKKFLRAVTLDSSHTLMRESQRFEERHNSRNRYSKLNGRTPLEALRASELSLRFPPALEAPPHPLPRPESGRYHLVRFVRSDGVLDVFGERFQAPPAAHYEYVRMTVDVGRERLGVYVDDTLLDEHVYPLR
jgi:putative transposase